MGCQRPGAGDFVLPKSLQQSQVGLEYRDSADDIPGAIERQGFEKVEILGTAEGRRHHDADGGRAPGMSRGMVNRPLR